MGQKCIVYTDNNPLSHLGTAKLGATEQRWAAQLSAFDFELKYQPGRSNGNADSWSRQYAPEDLEKSSPGTLLPETLKAKMDEERQGAVTQEVVTAFPYQSAAELSVLQ